MKFVQPLPLFRLLFLRVSRPPSVSLPPHSSSKLTLNSPSFSLGFFHRSQMRSPIQTLTEAKDSITSVVLTDHTLLTGSVDGFVREYDLRAGLLKEDYIGRE